MVDLPHEDRLRWIVEHAARVSDGGAEPVSGLVLPTAKFFPDKFDKTPASVAQLLKRVLKLAGLSDLDVRLQLRANEGEGGGGCSSGGCATGAAPPAQLRRVEPLKGGAFQVNIAANEIGNPTVLITGMVRAVSHIFMREAELHPLFARGEYEHGVDLVGVMLGFGTLLCNGAYVYRKG